MKIYRLEHKDTTLGPFQHDWPHQDGVDGIHASDRAMNDIDGIPEVKTLLKKNKGDVRFGFTNKRSFSRMIHDAELLEKLGFVMVRVQAKSRFVSECKQVVYLESEVVSKEVFTL